MNKRKEQADPTVFDVRAVRESKRANRTKLAAGRQRVSIAAIREQLTRIADNQNDLHSQRAALERIGGELDRMRESLADVHIERLRSEATELFRLPTEAEFVGDRRVTQSSERLRPSVILCDPPWSYSNPLHKQGTKAQYDTMSDEAIGAMPVAGLAADDAALLMWCTMPKLGAALRIMQLWGFEYKTVFTVWIKIEQYMSRFTIGYGAYTRPNAELVLIGTRGNMRTTLHNEGFRQSNVILSRPNEHSRKPPVLRNIATELFGDVPRIELFCRESGSDWLAWGNEVVGGEEATRVASEPESQRHAATERAARKNQLRVGSLRNAQARRFRSKSAGTGHSNGKLPASTVPYLERLGAHNCLTKVDAIVFHPTIDDPLGVAGNRTLDEFTAACSGRRHPLYPSLSETDVQSELSVIRATQIANADRLFAFNNNTKKLPRVRLTVNLIN